MIKAILILNTSGKVRLVRVYDETVSQQTHNKTTLQMLPLRIIVERSISLIVKLKYLLSI